MNNKKIINKITNMCKIQIRNKKMIKHRQQW